MDPTLTNHTAPSGTETDTSKLAQLLSYRPTPQQNLLFIAFLFPSILLYLINNRYQKSKSTQPSSPPKSTSSSITSSSSSAKDRPFGVWPPSDYQFPTPSPYPEWDIQNTKPLPYRPFRYGPVYHTTMGLRTIQPENWIELDSDYPKYHADKARRIAERREKCIKVAPEAAQGAVELLHELASYLPARYPSLFRRTDTGIDNLWSGESFSIQGLTGTGEHAVTEAERAMEISARLIQDDLILMYERPDGCYYLLAGAALLPGFWRLTQKFGMSLSELHTKGVNVPQYKEKLHKGMHNLFRRLKPEQMVGRNNYFIQVDDSLPWSWSIGDEDDEEKEGSWELAEDNKAVEHHYFRSERQTLRRLPKSGAVVFTIRTYFEPVTKIAEEDFVPGRLASAVRSWGDDVSKYKGKEKYGDLLLEFFG